MHTRAYAKDFRASRSLLQIASHVSAAIGIEFFQSMVRRLAEVLRADAVYMGEFVGGQMERVKTLATCVDSQSDRVFDYPLAGSAAAEVALGKPCLYRTGARKKFPDDELLQKLRAEAVIAVPLIHGQQDPLGVLLAVYRSPIPSTRIPKSMLEIFAPRAAAELSRKQSDEILREREQRHMAFISSNPDGMWRVEFENPIATDLPEQAQVELIHRHGYIAECNDALARFVGRSKAGEVVGSRVSELIELDSDQSMRAATLALVRAGYRLTTVETHPLGPDGRRRYVLRSQWGIVENGLLERIWGTSRDITELRKSELALDASEQRMADLLETMQLMVVMLTDDGIVAFCNDQLLRITGWKAADVKGKDWFDLMIPKEEQNAMRAAFTAAKAGAPGPAHLESPLMGPDGRRWWIAWDCSLLGGAPGQASAVVNVGRDITEYRDLEAQFRQAQKLESIGRLASGVAHDFNNLLTVIIGYSEALLAGGAFKESALIGLHEIRKAAGRGADLAYQLLAFSSRQTLRPTTLDLNVLVKDSERMLRRLIGDDIELLTLLDPALGLTRADAGNVHQVLLNLAVNSRDAMPRGGTLTISSSNVDVNGGKTAYPPGPAPGHYVQLAVSDTGTGMTAEVREHLFEPFFTTKAPGRGTGLGLSTVYGIVQQSGGHITVDTELDHGSTFTILFPRVELPADSPVAATKPELKGGTETILLVEDQTEVRVLAAKILRDLGYGIWEADGPAMALDLAKRNKVAIHLILTDLVMPMMGGVELADRIRQSHPGIKVLFMSGYVDRPIFERHPESRELPYLQKPFTPEDLGLKVRQVLDG